MVKNPFAFCNYYTSFSSESNLLTKPLRSMSGYHSPVIVEISQTHASLSIFSAQVKGEEEGEGDSSPSIRWTCRPRCSQFEDETNGFTGWDVTGAQTTRYVCVCVHACACLCVFVCMHACVRVRVRACVSAYMFEYMYLWVYTVVRLSTVAV